MRLRFMRWVGGAGGHVELAGFATFDAEGRPVYVDAEMRVYDSTWMLDDVLRRFRPDRFSVAYGDPWFEVIAT